MRGAFFAYSILTMTGGLLMVAVGLRGLLGGEYHVVNVPGVLILLGAALAALGASGIAHRWKG